MPTGALYLVQLVAGAAVRVMTDRVGVARGGVVLMLTAIIGIPVQIWADRRHRLRTARSDRGQSRTTTD